MPYAHLLVPFSKKVSKYTTLRLETQSPILLFAEIVLKNRESYDGDLDKKNIEYFFLEEGSFSGHFKKCLFFIRQTINEVFIICSVSTADISCLTKQKKYGVTFQKKWCGIRKREVISTHISKRDVNYYIKSTIIQTSNKV